MSAAIHWLFVLNNFTQIELDSLKNIFETDTHNFRYLLFQHEVCPTTNTPHLQGYLQCKKKKKLDQVKDMLGTQRVHLEKCKGSPQKNYDYCTKDRTAVDGPWEYGEMSGAGKRNDLNQCRDAIRENPYITNLELLTEFPDIVAKYPRFITTAKNAFQEDEIVEPEYVPRPGWQEELSRELLGEAGDRKVIWYCDVVGESGKSTFAKGFRKNGRPGFIVTGGKHADIYYAYERQPIVFFDFTRVTEDKVPWGVIENFKNGGFLSTKYESVWKKFKVPHVVIFANFMPDESKLSADRWDIREI